MFHDDLREEYVSSHKKQQHKTFLTRKCIDHTKNRHTKTGIYPKYRLVNYGTYLQNIRMIILLCLFVYSISMLNTFVSLKRLPGVDIEMIDIPVQITQQRNHSNAKYYHLRTHQTSISHNYC